MPQFQDATDIGRRVIELAGKQGRVMTEAETENSFILLRVPADFTFGQALEGNSAWRMAFGRLNAAGLKDKIEAPAVLWLTDLAEGIPGSISLMIAVIAAVVKDHKEAGKVTLEYVMRYIFPHGVPSKEVFSTVWTEQKLDGGNLVDQLAHC